MKCISFQLNCFIVYVLGFCSLFSARHPLNSLCASSSSGDSSSSSISSSSTNMNGGGVTAAATASPSALSSSSHPGNAAASSSHGSTSTASSSSSNHSNPDWIELSTCLSKADLHIKQRDHAQHLKNSLLNGTSVVVGGGGSSCSGGKRRSKHIGSGSGHEDSITQPLIIPDSPPPTSTCSSTKTTLTCSSLTNSPAHAQHFLPTTTAASLKGPAPQPPGLASSSGQSNNNGCGANNLDNVIVKQPYR